MTDYYISSTKYSLQERKTKLNGTVYDVVFRVVTLDGKNKQKKLSGYKNKTLAKQAYTDFVTEHCTLVKNNPLKKIKTDKDTPTVGELHRQYMAVLPNQNKESSIYCKQSLYDLFIKPSYENTSITDLTKQELMNWQDAVWSSTNPVSGEHYSYAYLERIRNAMSALLTWTESRFGYQNHLKELKIPKRRVQKTEMKIWTSEDFNQFISKVEDPTYHAFFTVLFYTGRRKGEVLALQSDSFDEKNKTIRISGNITRKTIDDTTYKLTSTKADKSQTIPVCDIVVKELSHYEGQTPFYFGGERPLADSTVSRVFKRQCEIAGVKTIRIHDLRHSFVSMLLHLGANFLVVADLIGDTVDQVIKTYAHMYQSDKLAIINKIK